MPVEEDVVAAHADTVQLLIHGIGGSSGAGILARWLKLAYIAQSLLGSELRRLPLQVLPRLLLLW